MEILKEAIIAMDKPFFIYNKVEMKVKVYPTMVEMGSKSITTFNPTTDEPVIKETIEEVIEDFDRLGFQMPEEDVWDFPERSIRLAIPNDELTEILKSYPMAIEKFSPLKDFTVVRNRTQFIYLTEIYPDDQALFNNYIQQRP